MNRVTLFFLSAFLILYGIIQLGLKRYDWLYDIRSTCACLAGLTMIFDICCRCRCQDTDHSHHHKLIVLFFLILSGSAYAADPYEVERIRWEAAGALALNPTAVPAPSPSPNPSPESSVCARCNGTGNIKPDGRITIPCPDCGGDGKMSIGDTVKLVTSERKNHDEIVRKLDDQLDKLKKMNAEEDFKKPLPVELKAQAKKDELTSIATSPTPITWLNDLDQLRWECKKQNKYGFIFFTGELNKPNGYCPPCEYVKAHTFPDTSVMKFLNDNFVCAKMDAGSLSREDQNGWGLSFTPSFVLVDPTWGVQLLFERPKDDDKTFYEPGSFLKLFEAEYKCIVDSVRTGHTKKMPVAQKSQTAYNGTTCECERTGRCVCDPSQCQCPNCPNNRSRYASRYFYMAPSSSEVYYNYDSASFRNR